MQTSPRKEKPKRKKVKFRDVIELEWLIRKEDEYTYRIQKFEDGEWVTIYKENFKRRRRLCDIIKRLFTKKSQRER